MHKYRTALRHAAALFLAVLLVCSAVPVFASGELRTDTASGFAWMMYVTDRFSIPELIGKTVIIHSNPDDFTTQPSGNSGNKIACGTIQAV